MSHNCTRCGRTLVDLVSISRGMGPECAKKSTYVDLTNREKVTVALSRAMGGPLPGLAVAAAKISSKMSRGKPLTSSQIRYKQKILDVYGDVKSCQ